MKNTDNLSYYEKNKDKILENVKSEKLAKIRALLNDRNFSENLAPWARSNSKSISLLFYSPDELIMMLLTDDIRRGRHDNIEEDRNEILVKLKSDKLHNKKVLLKLKKFPEIIAPWTRINKESISLNFTNYEEFDKFLSIKDDILNLCHQQRNDIVNQPNSNI